MLLEPPTAVSLSEQGGVVTVSWPPPALASAAGVPLGFRVEVTDGPRWTVVVGGGRSSTEIDYRGREGRALSAVAVATVLEIGRGPDGNPVYLASAPATASNLEVRGRQTMRLRAERVEETVECDDGKPPLIGVRFGCDEMAVTVDASGSFTFGCDEPGRTASISGRGRATGDRLHLSGSASWSRSVGEAGPESRWERLTVECTFSGETRLRAYREEGSVGIEKGLRGTCTSSLDQQQMSYVDATTGYAYVESHQRCTAEVVLHGRFIPAR